jgi:hypothetical protein
MVPACSNLITTPRPYLEEKYKGESMTEVTHHMTAAKCSPDDIDQIRAFLQKLETLVHSGTHKDLVEFVEKNFDHLCGRHYQRLIFGYETLLENACDPSVTHLAWKPELKHLIEEAGQDTREEDLENQGQPTQPMTQLELAARSVLDNFSKEWFKIERDLQGCTLQVFPRVDGKSVRWLIKGMPADRAEVYNARFAKVFGTALIGILNIPLVVLEFQVKRR